MKWHWIALVLVAGGVALYGTVDKAAEPAAAKAGAEAAPAADLDLSTDQKKVSYTLGLNIGGTLAQQGFDPAELDLDVEVFLAGLRDALTRQEPRITRAQMEEAIAAFEQRMEKRQAEREVEMRVAAQQNLQAGQKFLAENKKKEGVQSTESGLQYQVLEEGDGAKPRATDVVKVNYRGTLLSGQEFDSSPEDDPAVFPLNRVIPGWTEGVQLMEVGSKYRFFIPAELAYGERGSPPRIPPNATLIFDIELLGIEAQ